MRSQGKNRDYYWISLVKEGAAKGDFMPERQAFVPSDDYAMVEKVWEIEDERSNAFWSGAVAYMWRRAEMWEALKNEKSDDCFEERPNCMESRSKIGKPQWWPFGWWPF